MLYLQILPSNPSWYLNLNGEPYSVYKFKYKNIVVNIKKAQSGIFDNKANLKERTIYVFNFHKQFRNLVIYSTIFIMCIQSNMLNV